jgi:hypothetical protein
VPDGPTEPPATMHRGSSISIASDKEIKEIECSLTIPEEEDEEDDEDNDEGGVEIAKRKGEEDGESGEVDKVGEKIDALKIDKAEETK